MLWCRFDKAANGGRRRHGAVGIRSRSVMAVSRRRARWSARLGPMDHRRPPGGPGRHRRRRAAGSRGQGIVELALSLPLLLLLSVGVADVGRAFYYREAVINATREELHYAISSALQATGNTVCSTSAGSASTSIGSSTGSSINIIAIQGALESSSNGTAAGSSIQGATTTVTWHCAGGAALTSSAATSTDPLNTGSASIEVRTAYTFHPLTPLVGAIIGTPPIVSDLFGRAAY